MKRIRECPLLLLVILTGLTLTVLKVYGKIPENWQLEDISASTFENIEEAENSTQSTPQGTASGNLLEKETEVQTDVTTPEQVLSENQVQQTYSFSKVENSYFEDALFIGDSRTDGLQDYSKSIKGATFYSKVGMSIHSLLDSEIVVTADGGKITIEEALNHYSFGKIYIMVGINELGRGNSESFLLQYQTVVNRIRELQPNAIIYVQAIMKVSEEKSNTDPIFNNINIAERNSAIHTLEDKHTVFYLDMNEVVVDENGNLKKEYSFDGVHLKAVYYKVWESYLKENGIVK